MRYCSDFPEATCCDTCHTDEWYGYWLCEFDHAVVCCAVMAWCEENGIDLDAEEVER